MAFYIFGLPEFYCLFFFHFHILCLWFLMRVVLPSARSSSFSSSAPKGFKPPGELVVPWWALCCMCVLVLTFPAHSSALQPPPLEGAKHSFVHQVFYFCSSWIFQFSGCIQVQRLPKLLPSKLCPPNSPSWVWTERWFEVSGNIWQRNSEGKTGDLVSWKPGFTWWISLGLGVLFGAGKNSSHSKLNSIQRNIFA